MMLMQQLVGTLSTLSNKGTILEPIATKTLVATRTVTFDNGSGKRANLSKCSGGWGRDGERVRARCRWWHGG